MVESTGRTVDDKSIQIIPTGTASVENNDDAVESSENTTTNRSDEVGVGVEISKTNNALGDHDVTTVQKMNNDTVSFTDIPPLEIGDRCLIQWRDGTTKLASIVERRPSNYRKRSYPSISSKKSIQSPVTKGASSENCHSNHTVHSDTASMSSQDGVVKVSTSGNDYNFDFDGLTAHEIDYYVHYLNHDRRLDEWNKLSRFDLSTIDTSHRNDPESSSDNHHDSRRSRRSEKRRKLSLAPIEEEDSTQITTIASPNNSSNKVDQSLADLEREHEEITKVKNISKIVMGCWEVEAWYYSPYPDEYSQEDTLFVCEFCLKYMKYARTLRRHKTECAMRSPPGNEIYRENSLSVFEVDGKEHRIYCQNLCLLAKLFLDHKTLYYDVDPFFFYIITCVDEKGAHIVGYFSKEKVSTEDYNLACILTFPQFQKCGYGKFIISLSYELSKREKKVGSPEKPLSDLGKISYRSYWTHILMMLLAKHPSRKSLGIIEISKITAIKTEDIISTLQSLDMVKFWKGQHVVYVKEEAVRLYAHQDKRIRLCKSECLDWKPHSQRKKPMDPS